MSTIFLKKKLEKTGKYKIVKLISGIQKHHDCDNNVGKNYIGMLTIYIGGFFGVDRIVLIYLLRLSNSYKYQK